MIILKQRAIAYTENGKWGYRDKETNKILIPALYDEVSPAKLYFPFVKVQVKLNGKWGVRSIDNVEILPILYDKIAEHNFPIDYYILKIDDKYGIINEKSENVIPIVYDEIDVSGFYTIGVRLKNKWGLFSKNGEKIMPAIYDKIKEQNTFVEVVLNGKAGVVNTDGYIIIPLEYDEIYCFKEENTFGVKKNEKWQLLDRQNNPKDSQLYDNIKAVKRIEKINKEVKRKLKEKEKRKLTKEEKEKITFVVNDLLAEELQLPNDSTEYDVLMQQKADEFRKHLFNPNDPEEVEALVELANDYIDNKRFSSSMALIIMYDMWLNNSCVWPVGHNPQWAEWEKLKEKKAYDKR